MTHWERAYGPTMCGACGKSLAEGDPVLVVELPRVSRKKFRCVCCAGPAPPDLPTRTERSAATIAPMVKASAIAKSPLLWTSGAVDGRMAAANDRDPGEDD